MEQKTGEDRYKISKAVGLAKYIKCLTPPRLIGNPSQTFMLCLVRRALLCPGELAYGAALRMPLLPGLAARPRV